MTPRAHRRKLAAAALAGACAVVYLWMLFASRRGVEPRRVLPAGDRAPRRRAGLGAAGGRHRGAVAQQ